MSFQIKPKFEVDKIQKNLTKLSQLYISKKSNKKQNKSISKIDQEINSLIKIIENEISQIQIQINTWEQNPGQFKMTQLEVTRRKNQFNLIKSEFLNMKQDESNYNVEMPKTNTINEDKFNYQQTIQNQDQKIEKLIEQTNKVKKKSLFINNQITEQDELLHQLVETSTQNSNILNRMNKKLNLILQKTSNCKMMMIILLQLSVIYFIIQYL